MLEGNIGTWKQVYIIEVWPATSVRAARFQPMSLKVPGIELALRNGFIYDTSKKPF